MALALDGTAHANSTTFTSVTATLTTANANDLIIAIVTSNPATGNVVSIASAHTTGWTLRKKQAVAGGNIEEWVGKASSALTSEVITFTMGASITFTTIDVFGVSGADTTIIWDSNGALPDFGTNTLRSITTSNTNDFLIGAYRFGGTATPTQGAGWTKISGANFQLVEYQIVSATQSGLSVTIGTGNTDEAGGIADAVIQASAASAVGADAMHHYREHIMRAA